jgi:hypothetical protein
VVATHLSKKIKFQFFFDLIKCNLLICQWTEKTVSYLFLVKQIILLKHICRFLLKTGTV